jgi:hypothetical protein
MLAGCGESGKVLPVDELETKQGQLDAVRGQTGILKLEKAIQSYHSTHGSFPTTLDELVPDHLPALPTKPDSTAYGYDPATGKIIN